MKIVFPPLKYPERHGGPGYKRRVEFYRNYVPLIVARRLARSYIITPGSKGYQSRLIAYLKGEWEESLRFRMKYERETRMQAVRGLWEEWYKRYSAGAYEAVYDQREFLHDWLTDILSP